MATKFRITKPNGQRMTVSYNSKEERVETTNQLLADWEKYCNDNWLSGDCDSPTSREDRVRSFLDRAGYLLLRDNDEDTLSDYKTLSRSKSEIPVSSCPDIVNAYFYGEGAGSGNSKGVKNQMPRAEEKKKPSKKKYKVLPQTIKARRIDKIHDELPGGYFHFIPINTENVFAFEGKKYQLDLGVACYRPKLVRGEEMYDMDQIVIVTLAGALHFFTQDYIAIEDALVMEIAG